MPSRPPTPSRRYAEVRFVGLLAVVARYDLGISTRGVSQASGARPGVPLVWLTPRASGMGHVVRPHRAADRAGQTDRLAVALASHPGWLLETPDRLPRGVPHFHAGAPSLNEQRPRVDGRRPPLGVRRVEAAVVPFVTWPESAGDGGAPAGVLGLAQPRPPTLVAGPLAEAGAEWLAELGARAGAPWVEPVAVALRAYAAARRPDALATARELARQDVEEAVRAAMVAWRPMPDRKAPTAAAAAAGMAATCFALAILNERRDPLVPLVAAALARAAADPRTNPRREFERAESDLFGGYRTALEGW